MEQATRKWTVYHAVIVPQPEANYVEMIPIGVIPATAEVTSAADALTCAKSIYASTCKHPLVGDFDQREWDWWQHRFAEQESRQAQENTRRPAVKPKQAAAPESKPAAKRTAKKTVH